MSPVAFPLPTHSGITRGPCTQTMDHSFRSSRFDKLLVESGRLVADAGDHERALSELVERLEQTARSLSTLGARDASLGLARPGQRRWRGAWRIARSPGDGPAARRGGAPAAAASRIAARRLDWGACLAAPAAMPTSRSCWSSTIRRRSRNSRAVPRIVWLPRDHRDQRTGGHVAAHYARPEVAVLDVAMPVINGLEAARLLKASPVTRTSG